MSQKTAILFLSELHQISTNFDIFWQKDGKEAKIMPRIILASLPSFCQKLKFDEVLTKAIMHSFFETRCIS